MTKKRLEDLLREEAGKPHDSETEALPEMKSLSETNADPLPINGPATSRPKRTNPTKAELETTVSELEEALDTAHQNENSLQQQVADLQSELQEQKTLVEKLQEVLEHSDQLKAELEEAKAVILRLSATNSKTTQYDIRKGSKDVAGSQALSLKKLPHQVTQSDIPSKKLTDRDIGWFD